VAPILTFNDVLMLGGSDSPKVGRPTVSGAKVVGKILAQDKHRKVLHFRKRRKAGPAAWPPAAVYRGEGHLHLR
jgi:ribosomal protein L21